MAQELSEQTRTLVRSRIENYYELNQEEQLKAAIKVIAADFYIYCERNLMIQDKVSGEIVPFVLNWAQKLLVERVLHDIATGKPVRYIILKARQMGLSTVIEALAFWWTTTHRNIKTVIIAHETEASGNLYQMFKRYFDNCHPTFQPRRKYNNKKELVFDVDDSIKEEYKAEGKRSPGLGSEIKTLVAKEGKGRSATIHFFHGCLHKDSLVVLADGSSKKIKDVELGDLVITSSGATAPVSFKTMTGVKQTYKINTWMTNEPIIASKDHKILTIDGYKKTSELTKYDWIAKPKYHFDEKTSWDFVMDPIVRHQGGGSVCETKRAFALDEKFGYLVGYYLAEGHISKNLGRVTFTYEVSETFINNVETFFANTPKHLVEGNRGRTVFNDKFMANALNKLCGRVGSKHIPLFGNKDFFRGVFRGYMDGDGSKTDVQRERAPSIHEKIARNINRIGDMLGSHGSLHYFERERYGIPSKPVWVNSFCNGKNSKYKFIDGQCFVRVKSIEEFEVSETYDLEINHPDHNFETPSGVVSNSEVAFWEAKADVVSSAVQAVPLAPNTFAFLESTANGVGGYFYDEWQFAKKGESAFKPLFFAWHEHSEYEIEGEVAAYDDEELALLEIFKEKDYPKESWNRKILWRREKKKEFRSDPKKFYQEYPKDDMEAFLSSGRPVFDIDKLVKMEQFAQKQPSPKFGVISPNPDPTSPKKFVFDEVPVVFQDQDPAPLKIWDLPEENEKYVIGVDVSEGVMNNESAKKENDYSVIDVTRQRDLKTVARWRGHIDPDLLGAVVYALGTFYNTALVGVEVNNHGLTTVQHLRNKFYRNLYMRESSEEHQFQERTALMGFRTDRKTKPIIINNLVQAIREDDIIDLDIVFIRECMTYIRDDQGHTNAQEGMFDDTVMAKAIALKLSDFNSINAKYAAEHIHKPVKRNTNGRRADQDEIYGIATQGKKAHRSSSSEAVERRRAARKVHRLRRRNR